MQRFAPRGRIADANITWTGGGGAPVTAYAVKGRFEDLAVNAVDNFPGVSGITGSVEGTQDGGTVRLEAKNTGFELQRLFRAPLAFDTLDAHATWKHVGNALEVTIADAHFANADAEGSVAGTWRSLPDAKERSPGFVDLKGEFTRAVATRVANYLPNRIAATRDWLERSVQSGTSTHVAFEVKGDLWGFPFGAEHPGHFLVEGDIRDGRLKYHPDWPSIDAIEGTFKFENRRMEIRAQSAPIFASRATSVTAVIEDLAEKPPLLVLTGDIDTIGRGHRAVPARVAAGERPRRLHARGRDRGSGAPQAAARLSDVGHGPGARGGRLHLLGRHRERRAHARDARRARPALVHRARRARARDRRHALRQARLAHDVDAGRRPGRHADRGQARRGGDGGLRARGDRREASGGADWKARVVSGKQGSELVVTSDLKGLESRLPEPLAKAAGDARALTLTMSRSAPTNEVTTVALADGVNGRFSKSLAAGTERWNAALKFGAPVAAEPVREGLWLYGELP